MARLKGLGSLQKSLSRGFNPFLRWAQWLFRCIRSLSVQVRSLLIRSALLERLRKFTSTRMQGLSRLRKHKRAWTVTVVLSIAMLLTFFLYSRMRSKTTYYIAYVGRYQVQAFDELHVHLLTKYIDELNAQLSDIRFELKIFDIQKEKTYDSTDAYRQIADDARTVLVIDNTWGQNLKAVAEIIVAKHIPVISMNADTQSLPYNNQVAFIGYDDDVPAKIIAFVTSCLHNQNSILVAEDEHTFASTGTFLRELPGAPFLSLTNSNAADEDEERRLFDSLAQQLDKPVPPGQRRTLILNTHWVWGNKIIDFIRQHTQYRDIDILGGPYITNEKLTEINLTNGNSLIIFTDSSDAITNKVYREVASIKSDTPKLAATLNTELFVERCINAVAIAAEGVFATEAQKQRKGKISKDTFIVAFRDMANSYFVRNGELYSFDDKLLLADKRLFEQYLDGEVSSYPQQLNKWNEVISNIHVGMDDIHISSIDTGNRSFHARFIYWLKSNSSDLNSMKYLEFRNLIKGEDPKELPSKNRGSAGIYRIFEMSGDFRMNVVDLARYPFDQQDATIELEAIYPPERLHISFDHDNSRLISEEFSIDSDEWNNEGFQVTVDNVFSQPVHESAPSKYYKFQTFETLNVRNLIRRSITGPIITIILPLWMMGLAGIVLLYVRDGSLSHIGHVCVGIFVTIGMYRIAVAQLVPNSGGGTVLDRLFFGTFLTIFLVFLKVVIFDSGMATERVQMWAKDRATVIGHWALIVYSLLVVLALRGWDVRIFRAISR